MTRRDVWDIGKLVALALIAWILPPRFWRNITRATRSIGRSDNSLAAYKTIFAHTYSDSEIVDIMNRHRAYVRELNLQIMGLIGRWRAWRPDVGLNGEEHLRKALAGGQGVILWVTYTAFSTIIVKMALASAGYRSVQLSRPGHGFSMSHFGVRFLNPIWTRVEDRFIAERVLILGESAADALTILRRRLAENRIVLVTVVPEAHRLIEVPFLNTKLRLPTGPIRLAHATGAVLLPVFSTANSSGGFEVSIEEQMRSPAIKPDDKSIAATYAKRLELFVTEHPDQWSGFLWLTGESTPIATTGPT